jgi:hypothetical protein
MTEYKQLTASGLSVCAVGLHGLADLLVSPGSPDGMFTAGEGRFLFRTLPSSPCADLFILHPGPISESDFFTWEALICGPKDTPFVIIPILFPLYFRPFIEIIILFPPSPPPSLRRAAFLPPNYHSCVGFHFQSILDPDTLSPLPLPSPPLSGPRSRSRPCTGSHRTTHYPLSR